MKTVIKKEPDTFKAIQWTGTDRQDYEVFITETGLYNRYGAGYIDKEGNEYDTEYYAYGNRLVINKNLYNNDRYERIEVPQGSWIILGYSVEVLSNLEFHKKHKILPLK